MFGCSCELLWSWDHKGHACCSACWLEAAVGLEACILIHTHTHTPVKEKVVEGKERGSWAIAEMGRKLGWLLVDGIG